MGTKKVGAPKDNTNAETWTLKEAAYIFKLVEDNLNKKYQYNVSGSKVEGFLCHFLGESCSESETTIDRLKYVRDKYKLKDWYLSLKRKSESNCFTDTKKGIINTAAGIMSLKSNNGWTDRIQSDHTTQGEKLQPQFIVGTKEHGEEVNDFVNDIIEDKD